MTEAATTERWADAIAQRFHEAYERLAPEFGYETRAESAVPWEDVPEANRLLMRAVVADVFEVVAHFDPRGNRLLWSSNPDPEWWFPTFRVREQSGSSGGEA